jgi:two-component system sensor histidine kinase KdpD
MREAMAESGDSMSAAAGDNESPRAEYHSADANARLVVAIAPDEEYVYAEQILRAGRRFATALCAQWTVVCVETPLKLGLVNAARDSRLELFRLAESLGAETVTLEASTAAEALTQYVDLCDAGTLLLGAPRQRLRLRPGHSTLLSQIMRHGPVANVIVVPRDSSHHAQDADAHSGYWFRPRRWTAYLGALGLTGLCTAVALPMLDHFDLIDMVMVYMLGATLASLRLGRGPAVLCSVANIAAFDYFFIPPRFSFWVSDPHYVVTFVVMLGVALIIASLVSAVRQQTVSAVARERQTAVLYALSRELAVTRDASTMAAVAERHITEVMRSRVIALTWDEHGRLTDPLPARDGRSRRVDRKICEWVMEHRQRAGLGSEHFASERDVYLPLIGSQEPHGVLIVTPVDRRRAMLPEQGRLLENLATQVALALERVRLVEVVQRARLAAERAVLRNTLLASISHDLRTPLSAIAGAGSMMAHEGFPLDLHRRTTLGRLIEDKARDMTELLTNVLELMRLETADSVVKGEWQPLDELVSQTLQQAESRLGSRQLHVDIPAGTPPIYVEGKLIVQMLNNLVENCIKYTPPGTIITIAAHATEQNVIISVEDDGPGFPLADPDRLFDKFERGRVEDNAGGVGLGLAICRAVARLHGGEIRGLQGSSGGARVEIILPRKPWKAKAESAIA